MKIGIIGYHDSVKKLMSVLTREYEDIKFLPYDMKQLGDSVTIYKDIKNKVDGVFVTGIGVYSEISSLVKVEKPLVYATRGAACLLKTLWEVRNDYGDIANLKLGLDIIDRDVLEETLEEFGIKIGGYELQEHFYHRKEEEFLDEHIENLKNQKVDCILTAFGYVYEYFKKLNIPVYRLQASKNEIVDQMNILLRDITIKSNEKNRIGIKILRVSRNVKSESFYDQSAFKMKLNHLFLEYSKKIHGSFQEIGNGEYMFITTQKIIEETDKSDCFSKIVDEIMIPGNELGVGIGYGESIQEAERNALKALNISLNSGKGDAYLFSDNKIRGPLYKKNRIDYSIKIDEDIIEEAKAMGISPKYLSKIQAVQKLLGKREFTSSELAENLQISERSVNRILKPIIENGFAIIIESEVSSKVGRPRRVIRFKF
nr:HTH domain-containing protein [uncultured Cetobacterium sp.]